MELWMYLVVIGMFLVATIATVWMTLWTIQRGERRRNEAAAVTERAPRRISTTSTSSPTTASADEGDSQSE